MTNHDTPQAVKPGIIEPELANSKAKLSTNSERRTRNTTPLLFEGIAFQPKAIVWCAKCSAIILDGEEAISATLEDGSVRDVCADCFKGELA